MSEITRAVFDCNILLQALSAPDGPAGKCVQLAIDGKVGPYLSPAILEEFHEVSSRPRIIAQLRLDPARVAEFSEAIQLAATILAGFPESFAYARDPDDAEYVNAALVAGAEFIVTRDRDLLDLMDAGRPDGREFKARFPTLTILNPVQFLQSFRDRR